MNSNNSITFPLSDHPTHYVACIEDAERLDCTHVAIKLTPSTLIRLVWMYFVASVLRLIGIKATVFESKVGVLDVACLRYTGNQFLEDDQGTSGDDAPYDCLSLGELAALGGYATNAALDAWFAPAMTNDKAYAVEVYVQRFSMWLKICFFGQTLHIETNPFNLDIIVKDFLAARIPPFLKGGRHAKQ